MPSTLKAIDVGSSSISPSTTSTVASAARVALSKAYHYNNTILLPSLEERLHSPPTGAAASASTSSSSSTSSLLGSEINSSTGLTSISHVASVVVSNFLPLTSASLSSGGGTADTRSVDDTTYSANSYISASELTATSDSILSSSSSAAAAAASASLSSASSSILSASSEFYPSYSPPVVESLVASSAEDFSNNFRDLSFDIFDDNDNDLFGSPMPFDASENGLWNGRFVPPPPRPPFFVDEPVLSDGLTTCDLCSWAMPTKSTFIFEGTMEKASELGWPLTLTIVSILSAILGAIIMIAVVKCRRKKTSHQRSDTHVQWWSRNKRPNGNNNHLRRSNIYTAHPVDSIRGLQQPSSLSASSSMTAMTTAMTVAAAAAPPNSAATLPFYHHAAGQQHGHTLHQLPHSHSQHSHLAHHHHHPHQQQQQGQQYLDQEQHYFEHEHEYHQPQELQLQLHPANATAATTTTATLAHPPSYHSHGPQQQHLHQHQHSGASMSSTSTSSMPSLSCMPLQRQLPERDQQPIHFKSGSQAPQHVLHMQQHEQQQQHQQSEQSPDLHHDNLFHWPTATSLVTS
ncbi:lateral signaling target protein 2 homolog [Musca domestica]|uniref:Lateral signaling target protein 2 homolog n=1 Tax=Musca domestica TaxID=7370 RepID=A0ABM3VQV9_MUSDO|nr:lateral signaling target protein 2 homolog [Musca domestica]